MEYKEIKKLMDDVGDSKLSEVEIEFPDGTKISLKKDGVKGQIVNTQQPLQESQVVEISNNIVEASVNTKKEEQVEENIVKSPMVGTFYAKSSPTAEPFVKKGSMVKKGDTLCIIEAMKLMNEIESEFDGEVVDILVKNEEIVDFGKPLFVIK